MTEYQLHLLRGFAWLSRGPQAHAAQARASFDESLVCLHGAGEATERRDAEADGVEARARAARDAKRLFMVAAKCHEGLGFLATSRSDPAGYYRALDAILKIHDWEPYVAFPWRARRGLRRLHEGDDDGAVSDLATALAGASPAVWKSNSELGSPNQTSERTLELGQIDVDSADFWTNHVHSSSSRSATKESGPSRSSSRTLKSG